MQNSLLFGHYASNCGTSANATLDGHTRWTEGISMHLSIMIPLPRKIYKLLLIACVLALVVGVLRITSSLIMGEEQLYREEKCNNCVGCQTPPLLRKSSETRSNYFADSWVNESNSHGNFNEFRHTLNIFSERRTGIFHCVTGKHLRSYTTPSSGLGRIRIPKKGLSESHPDRAGSFEKIFVGNKWGGHERNYKGLAVSGPGSVLRNTQEQVATLHTLIGQLKQFLGRGRISMLDLPCGDMQWMSRFLQTRDDIDYTGMDIVPAIIQRARESFWRMGLNFQTHDIVSHPLKNSYDVIHSRHMLQHLTTKDALRALRRFSDSGSRYLITTTFISASENLEVPLTNISRYRALNLELPPISLPPPLCLQRDDPPMWTKPAEKVTGPSVITYTGLWELPLKQIAGCSKAFSHKIKIFDGSPNMFSCTP